GIEKQVVGHEARGAAERLQLYYRMSRFHKFNFTAVIKARPDIGAVRRQLREAGQHVELRQRQRRLPDAARLGGHGGAQLGKNPALQLDNLFLGVEHFGFVLLELAGSEALGIDQRLLALVVGGRQMLIGFGDLDVIAEDGVEFDLERANAGALPLPLLDGQNVLPGVVAQVAQLVEATIDTRGDDSAIAKAERRFRRQGGFNLLAHIAEFIQRLMKFL